MSPEGVDTFSYLKKWSEPIWNFIDVPLTRKINIIMLRMQELLFWLGGL